MRLLPVLRYLTVVSVCVGVPGAFGACPSVDGHDFTSLDGVVWDAYSGTEGNSPVKYQLSVCKPLSELNIAAQNCLSEPTAACQINKDGTVVSVGKFVESGNIEQDADEGIIQLTYEGVTCSSDSGTDVPYTTVINFKCGKTLGSPVFLDVNECRINFEWYSTVACKSPPTVKEVKCYAYNDQGEKFDLSPLIRTTGGHKVRTTHDEEFYVNVCRDITPAGSGATSDCDVGAASCLPSAAGPGTSIGYPSDPVTLKPTGELSIAYVNGAKGDTSQQCTEAPTTEITFRCPNKGMGSEPVLSYDRDCHYEVVWETEYACPEQTLTSNTCKLDTSVHGINVDLTLLMATPKYHTTGTNSDGSVTYDYWVSVCQGLRMACPESDDSVTVCQTNGGVGKPLGRLDNQKLRYSDGDLVLTYTGGQKCRHNDFHRETVINFHCNQTGGNGNPEFISEDDCTYIFDWSTSLACVNPTNELTCQVEGGGHTYDLSVLTRYEKHGEYDWDAIPLEHTNDTEIMINVCDRLTGNGLSRLCQEEAAACTLVTTETGGKWLSLGHPANPTYNTATSQVELQYTDGSKCPKDNDKTLQALIRFSCKPGHLESAPVLERKSSDGCEYEFKWETAAVCDQPEVTGSDCQLTDPDLGVTFDLRPLKAEGSYYNVTGASGAQYYINVCDKLSGSPCDGRGTGEWAACQKTTDGDIFSTGAVSSSLSYVNGFLNLTYAGGDPYHTEPPIARTTEIAFRCDAAAGTGTPEFASESDHVYLFLWYTKYACVDTGMECLAVDNNTHTQYDLTSLSKSESNWLTTSDSSGTERLYYINVCRGLVSGVAGCAGDAGVCELEHKDGKEQVSHGNLGAMTSRPKVVSRGELELVYTGGATCDADSTKNYTTTISLHCDHGATGTSPVLLSSEDCHYVFEWYHMAACPLHTDTPTPAAEICTLRDEVLDYTYNLQPISKQDYTVTVANEEQIKLHICGAVSGECKRIGEREPGACLGSVTVGAVSTSLSYSSGGQISLQYGPGDYQEASGDQFRVVIEFECDLRAAASPPEFREMDGATYVFTMRTPYVCAPAAVECRAESADGKLYDLSPLARGAGGGNWEVVDTRAGHSDLRYFINVCKPVDGSGTDNFCSGPVGACQTSSSDASYSLGYIQGAPVVVGDGQIVLRYTNGDRCHVGKETESYRSSVITFSCAQTESDPVFVAETPDCEYQFSWSTPAACEVQVTTGTDCRVQEPIFHTTFDLTSLRKDDQGYYKAAGGDYEYWLNVCGALPQLPDAGGCQGAASCQTKDDGAQKINGGMPSSTLTYTDGAIRLVYKNGKEKCHGQYDRETVITFRCDHSVSGVDAGLRHVRESPTCQYLFDWATPLACPPRSEVTECSIRDDQGNQYDLSGLRLVKENYEYVDQQTDTKYLINVCGNVVHGEGAACDPVSAVCAVDIHASNDKYRNIGSVTPMKLEMAPDGAINLVYSGGDQCPDHTQGSTVIKLRCQHDAQDSQPVLVDGSDKCHYVFEWETSFACPVSSAAPGKDCKVSNPQTGHVFDLSSLKGQTYTLDDDTGDHKFDVSICGPLQNSPCGDNVGSCQYEPADHSHKWASGVPSSSLRYLDGILQLNYTGGALCHGLYPRSTVINFVCGTQDKPTFIQEEDDCTYTIYWHTQLACEGEAPVCSVSSPDSEFDLSPLVLADGYHSAVTTPEADTDSDASYYISVCRPLNPVTGVTCPPDAAVCRLSGGKATSLGKVAGPPQFDAISQEVSLQYTNGDKCGTGDKRWQTHILFVCEPGLSLGVPSLIGVNLDDCVYVFAWETYLVCPPDTTVDTDSDCTYTDSRTEYTYDFTALKPHYYSVPSQTEGTYYVGICSSVDLPGCKPNSVCLKSDKSNSWISFGKPGTLTFLSTVYNIKMNYGEGDQCVGGKRQSHVLFECDSSAEGSGVIELSYETECSVAFVYKTRLACLPVTKDCILPHAGITYDVSPLSRETGSWNVTNGNHDYFWLNLCQAVHSGPVGCPSDAAACWQPAGDTAVHVLGTVQSQTLSRDGQGRIVVSHSGGDAICRDGKRGVQPQFTVYLTCGAGLGRPEILPRKSDPCVFEMEWSTVFACEEKREPIFKDNGVIKDPTTGVSVKLLDLTGGRTFSVTSGPYKYMIQLEGESSDCDGHAVCQIRTAAGGNGGTPVSLGEASTATFYIKGDVLEAHYTSPTKCDSKSDYMATSIINFKCSGDDQIEDPVFVYKSKKCQYIFDWKTPGVCELYNTASVAKASSPSSRRSLVIGGVVAATMLVLVIAGAVLYNPDRRARIGGALRRVFRRPNGYTSYSYSQLNRDLEEDNTLLRSSQGRYGADSGGAQSFFDDSDDEDILQL